MERTLLGNNLEVSRIGQGLGTGFSINEENVFQTRQRIEALIYGIEVGLTFIDTAESYGGGLSEELIGTVGSKWKRKIQIGTKFSPENSSFERLIRAADASLARLGTEVIHLYQVHWPNPSVPLEETFSAMKHLREIGKIQNIGVCNFSKNQLEVAIKVLGRGVIVSNQLEYNLFDRFIEDDILPYCASNGVKVIAYSPLDKGRVFPSAIELRLIDNIAKKYQMTREQLSLAWLLRDSSVLAIPASTSIPHLKQNAECLDKSIEPEDFEMLSSLKQEVLYVLPKEINVSEFGEENRKVYKSIDEAKRNSFNLVPSPIELARDLSIGEPIKPVRVVPSSSGMPSKSYDLIEGRSRYWSWVIAFGVEKPIPVYLRNTKEKEI